MRLGRTQKALLSEAISSSDRSTAPDAKMNLLLRFETQSGPRTVVASGVPFRTASEITKAMILSGQYAEYIDQCTPLPIRELVKIRKRQKAPKHAPATPLSGNDNIITIAKNRTRAI